MEVVGSNPTVPTNSFLVQSGRWSCRSQIWGRQSPPIGFASIHGMAPFARRCLAARPPVLIHRLYPFNAHVTIDCFEILTAGGVLMRSSVRFAALFVLLLAPAARAAETEIQYLSGLGKDDPIQWEFMCDKGQNANKWSTIGVPSNWQLQGFGIYEYGRPDLAGGWPRTHGIY